MAVVIQEFEAVAEPGSVQRGQGSGDPAPKPDSARLRAALARIDARDRRLKAH